MLGDWLAYPVLLRPGRIRRNLHQLERSGRFPEVPNTWQLTLGVLRMWHRLAFRSETVGLCVSHPPRANLRARLFQYRPVRFPFLLREGAVTPLDLTGLVSQPATVIKHLLGTHHDGKQFAYDLELLASHPGQLEALARQVRELIARDGRRARWLRDLTVYETYHERLAAAVERALEGDFGLTEEEASNPDISFGGYLAWCRAQPETPGETWALIRTGRYTWRDGRTDDPTRRAAGASRGIGQVVETQVQRAARRHDHPLAQLPQLGGLIGDFSGVSRLAARVTARSGSASSAPVRRKRV